MYAQPHCTTRERRRNISKAIKTYTETYEYKWTKQQLYQLPSILEFWERAAQGKHSETLLHVGIELIVTKSQALSTEEEEESNKAALLSANCLFTRLPDHLLIEIFIRVPISEWGQVSCVQKHWADLFRGECLWHAALIRSFPLAGQAKRWPGPIPCGLSRRRFTAFYVCKYIFSLDDEMDEIVGHSYLFLKEQLEISTMPPPSGVLHGTIIDQFIACGKSRDKAHELASLIWLAVIDNFEENQETFLLLKRLAFEGDVFLSYPYSRSYKVQWRIFERLFTDFRDCFNQSDYYELLALAKHKFLPIPSTWLGY